MVVGLGFALCVNGLLDDQNMDCFALLCYDSPLGKVNCRYHLMVDKLTSALLGPTMFKWEEIGQTSIIMWMFSYKEVT